MATQVNGPNGPLGSAAYGVQALDPNGGPMVWIAATIPWASVGHPGQFTIFYTDIPAIDFGYMDNLVSAIPLSGSPVCGRDYTLESSSIDFVGWQVLFHLPDGNASGNMTINVNVPTDSTQPGFVMMDLCGTVLLAPTNLLPYGGSASVTILDQDVLSIAPPVAEEPEDSGAAMQFTVSRSGPDDQALTVDYSVGGTAVPGVDYTQLPGSVTIPAGQDQATINVTPIDDLEPDVDKTVVLTLQSSSAATVDPDAQHAAAVLDDDLPTVSFVGTLQQTVDETATGFGREVTFEADLPNRCPTPWTLTSSNLATRWKARTIPSTRTASTSHPTTPVPSR